jgi:cell wall-associated NlpC family hydrolase
MTIGSVDLAQIQQTLSALELAAGGPAPAGDEDASFATNLQQATSALAAGDDQSEALEGGDSASGSDGDLDLISMLLAASQGDVDGSGAVDSSGALSGLAGSASEPPAFSSGAVTGEDVVSEASQFEGTPYVWGGTTPQGFDCSGFTQYVYGQLGIQLPRTSEMQASSGTPVSSLAAAQPGDLVFFAGSDGTASSPGHVGIYIGNGEMIDAPHSGTAVQVQPVASAGPVVAIRQVLPTDSSLSATAMGDTSGSATVMGNVSVPAAYASTIEQAAASQGIPSSLLAALVYHESRFTPNAVSSAGAEGIAQFMPATAAGMGINPDDPTEAINAAAELLGSYTTKFGSYADALAAYDAGPSAVEAYGGIPPYAETQAAVPAILSLAGLTGTEGAVT